MHVDLARAAGLDVDAALRGLALDPNDLEGRFGFDAAAAFLDRVCAALGEDAMENHFAFIERALPDLVMVVRAFPSLGEMAAFLNTKVWPANMTCVSLEHTPLGTHAYALRARLHSGYRPSPGMRVAMVAHLRGQPRLQGMPEAQVRWDGSDEDFTCRVQLPLGDVEAPSAPSMSALDRGRAGPLLSALLADRAHFRRDSLRLGRAFTRLGREAFLPTDAVSYARAIADSLRDDLGHRFTEVWSHHDGEETLLASVGSMGEAAVALPLTVGDAVVGKLVTDDVDGRETLVPLVSLLALGLIHRRERGARPRLRGVFPEEWKLTKRQREIAEGVCDGSSNPDIARALGCSIATVEDHLTAVFAKARVDGRQLLAARVHAFRRTSAVDGE